MHRGNFKNAIPLLFRLFEFGSIAFAVVDEW